MVQRKDYLTVEPKTPMFVFGEKVLLPVFNAIGVCWTKFDRAVSGVFNFIPPDFDSCGQPYMLTP